MKKYIYKPQKFIDARRVKWTENGLEEIDSFVNHCWIEQIYFDTLDELKEELEKQFYSIDFIDDYDDMIFVHWYETTEDSLVKIDDSDPDWRDWNEGKISLWEYSLCIEPSDIYLNQTIESLDELR